MKWRRRRGFGRRRRTVAWIPGFTAQDIGTVAQSRLLTLTNVSTALFANVFGAAVQLTVKDDLSSHGGEDAVLTRIVGRLGFFNGRVDVGAGAAAATFITRMLVVQADTIETSAATMPFEFLSSNGLGQDDILHTDEVVVPGTSVLRPTGATFDTAVPTERVIDIRVKRKLQQDRQVFLWFQSAFNDVTTTSADFRIYGHLRMLLMRPR